MNRKCHLPATCSKVSSTRFSVLLLLLVQLSEWCEKCWSAVESWPLRRPCLASSRVELQSNVYFVSPVDVTTHNTTPLLDPTSPRAHTSTVEAS